MPTIALEKPQRDPSYRLHRPSGQAVVTLSGRDFYLGTYGTNKSREAYDRLLTEWKASGRTLPTGKSDFTVVELLAAFKRHAKEYYRGHDGKLGREGLNYLTLMRRLTEAYGRTPAAEFGPLKLKAFRQSLIDQGLARTNINHQVNRIRHIFKWGVENELVPAAVYDALRCVAGLRYGKSKARETEPIRPVADAVVEATLRHLPPQLQAMVQLQQLTGMRSGEVVLMRTCDINTAGSVWTYTPQRHKTQYRGHARVVYLGPLAQAVLRSWLRTNLEEYLFQPSEVEQWRREQRHKARKTPLSCGNRPGTNRKGRPQKSPGERYMPESYGKAIRYACEVAFGMPAELRKRPKVETPEARQARQEAAAQWRAEHTWHPHQLRHNAATRYRREHGLEVARVLLGHKHAAITETYAEVDRQRAIEVAEKIG